MAKTKTNYTLAHWSKRVRLVKQMIIDDEREYWRGTCKRKYNKIRYRNYFKARIKTQDYHFAWIKTKED